MFAWITGFVNFFTPTVPQAVRDLVHWTVHALAGIVHTLFVHAAFAYLDVYNGAAWLWRHSGSFGLTVLAWIRQIVTVDIPVLWHILLADVRGLLADIGRVWNLAQAAIQRALNFALLAVSHAVSWVVTHVWAPLKAYADTIYRDLLKWGYFAWKLLTDPPRLASLLIGYLIAAAEQSFFTIAGPAGRFLLGLILHNARKIVVLIEDIVTAAL